MRLYLVRHGETDWNKQRRIQGQVDIQLNEFGRHLARETAKGLSGISFDVCYTSPLGRARETAEIILQGRDVEILADDRITEMAFGEYEGKCCSTKGWELPESFRSFFHDPEHYVTPPQGEHFLDVKRRTGGFMEELYAKSKYCNANILLTTHGAALASILNNIKKEPLDRYWGDGVHKNCGVTEVLVTDATPKIMTENVVYYKDEVAPWEQ